MPSTEATVVFSRVIHGNARKKRDRRAVQVIATMLTDNPPTTDGERSTDYYYWLHASLALFQLGGDAWTEWAPKVKKQVRDLQRRTKVGDATHGSWDTTSAFGEAGGRVYATAMNALTLLTPTRYPRVLDADD